MDFIDFSWVIDFFWQSDKQKHILLSAAILIFDFIVRYFFIQKRKNSFYAISFALRDTIFIWLFKEIIDMMWFWTASLMDFVWDTIWFLFPIYLYFSYKESKKFLKKDIFNYLDDSLRHLFSSLKTTWKETWESIKYWFSYFNKVVRDRIDDSSYSDIEMFKSKNKSKIELQEWISSIKNLLKSLKYLIIFIIYWILDFIIEFIKMPFYIFGKTLYIFFKSMTYLLKKFS